MATIDHSTELAQDVLDVLRQGGWITPPGCALRIARKRQQHTSIYDAKRELDALVDAGVAECKQSGTVRLYRFAGDTLPVPVA
jgi:hypothetical protein